MKKMILIITVLLVGCTNAEQSTRALEASGYKEISMNGYTLFGCDDKDTFRDSFTAKGANGKYVEGVVCSGWFKGSTIRVN